MSGFQPRLSEPGFTGFPDFQDKTLVHQSAIQRTNINLQIGTLESQTHNPENPGSDTPLTFPRHHKQKPPIHNNT